MMRNLRGAYMNFTHDRPQDWAWLAPWQPNVIRLMLPGSHSDPASVDVNRIRRVHETCPDATILLRVWDVDDRNFEAHAAMVANPTGEADKQIEWWARLFDRVPGVPRGKLMAGLNNETGPEKDAKLYHYTEWALIRGKTEGVPLGVLVFSVGRPALAGEAEFDIPRFAQLEPLIVANKGAVVLHEYLQPEGMYAVWTDKEGNERKDYSYLVGRHTRWPLSPAVPVIIGEWGIDGILYNRHPDPVYGNSGWRNFKDLWPPSRYADEYVECIRKASDNVIGICPFISDWADHKWQSFDLIDAYDELLKRKDLCVKEAAAKPVETRLPQIEGKPTTPAPVPPLVHPVTNPAYRIVTQGWGERPDYYSRFAVDGVPLKGHNGLDFGTPLGTVIAAVDGGRVVEVADDPEGYGLYVKLSHTWGESLYAHLRDQLVQVGEWANKGQYVGKSGNTGNSTGPHLHFGLRVAPFNRQDGWGGFTDPSPYLKTDAAPLPRLTNEHLLTLIKAAAQEFGLEWEILSSLSWAESSWNPQARSSAGAKGMTQIMSATWAEWSMRIAAGDDPFDARQNLRVGAAYFKWLLQQTHGSYFDALVAYGWGIGNWLNHPGGTSDAPEIWVDYAAKVMHGYDLLKAAGA